MSSSRRASTESLPNSPEMSELEPSDKRSAFIGMIVTSIALFLFAYGIVQWTNSLFEGGESHAPAGAVKH